MARPATRQSISRELKLGLEDRSLSATPQALSALTESIVRSPTDIVGDTDSMLLGLLYSGSYTIDVLEKAARYPRALRTLAAASVGAPLEFDHLDPVKSLLEESSTFWHELSGLGRTIETADLLRTAISPQNRERVPSSVSFPRDLVVGPRPTGRLNEDLHEGMCELIVYFVSTMLPDIDSATTLEKVLRSRRTAVTDDEDKAIDKRFGIDYPTMTTEELEFAIAVVNTWYSRRTILTDPPELCVQLLNRCSPLLFGPAVFAGAGGNAKFVDSCLDLASAVAPERDSPQIAMFVRDGRVHLGQYTYRDTVAAHTPVTSYDFQSVSLQAIRPTSLLPVTTIAEFEDLISRDSTRERHIQAFLGEHPEFLEALGYAKAHPHICLRAEKNPDLIPDFILERPGGLGFDILDLKLPSAPISASQPYLRMSGEITKAIAQLRKYEHYFDNATHRNAFYREHGFQAFRPEIIVVIGRSSEFVTREDRLEIEEQMSQTKLLTYDDLIAYGRSRAIVLPHSGESW